MRKTLFAGALVLLSSLAAMATAPSGHGGSHMSEFKLQSGVSQTDVSRSNLTYFQDLTSEMEKERLVRKGIKLNHFFNTPETTDGRIQPANAPMREGEERYTLTVNLKYDKEEVARVSNCVAYPNYARGFWFRNEWSFESQPDKVNFNLPEGSYDIEVIMYTADMNFILLTASDIEVINDCEISLDTAEATIDIVWDPLMPDGTTPFTDIVVYEPDTFDVIEDIPGNVLAVFNKLNVYNKNFEIKSAFRFNTITYFVGDEKHVEGLGNIKTNSSDKYLFFLDKQVIGRDGGFIIPLTADALESKIVTNNINDYITLKPEFASTPHEPEQLITEEEPEIYEFNK